MIIISPLSLKNLAICTESPTLKIKWISERVSLRGSIIAAEFSDFLIIIFTSRSKFKIKLRIDSYLKIYIHLLKEFDSN